MRDTFGGNSQYILQMTRDSGPPLFSLRKHHNDAAPAAIPPKMDPKIPTIAVGKSIAANSSAVKNIYLVGSSKYCGM